MSILAGTSYRGGNNVEVPKDALRDRALRRDRGGARFRVRSAGRSGSLFPILGSAQALAYGPSVTALDAPWADRENPAASAAQQRTVLDAGYTALTDFGAAANGRSQGFGGAGALGLSIPKPYAVWSAGLDFVSTPSSMTALPFGTVVEASAAA